MELPISHTIIQSIFLIAPINFSFLSIDFQMRNVYAHGGQQFEMQDLNFNAFRKTLDFDVIIPIMTLIGDHTTYASLIQGNVNVPVSGKGAFTMKIHGLRVSGTATLEIIADGKLHLSNIISTVVIKSLDANLSGFGLMSGLINSIISSAGPGIIADNQDLLNAEVNGLLMPLANGLLNQMTMNDLVNMLADRHHNPPAPRCPV
jgi:hypothetical protein